MADFVLDASLTLAFYFHDEKTSFTEGVLDRIAQGAVVVAPALWGLETRNSVRSALRRQRITRAEADEMLTLLGEMPLRLVDQSDGETLHAIALLAFAHGLSVYDATYFHLARQEACPLATLDGPLRRAAEAAGWPVIAPA